MKDPVCRKAGFIDTMKKHMAVLLTALFVFVVLLSTTGMAAGGRSAGGQSAEGQSPKTFTMDDRVHLLTNEHQDMIVEKYSAISEYLSAAFVTTNNNPDSAGEYAKKYAIEHYGNAPAVVFLYDVGNRDIFLYVNGSAKSIITKTDATVIINRIKKYVPRYQSYYCTDDCFDYILTKCRSHHLVGSVKHITNAMIAVLIGILINISIAAFSRAFRQGSSV